MAILLPWFCTQISAIKVPSLFFMLSMSFLAFDLTLQNLESKSVLFFNSRRSGSWLWSGRDDYHSTQVSPFGFRPWAFEAHRSRVYSHWKWDSLFPSNQNRWMWYNSEAYKGSCHIQQHGVGNPHKRKPDCDTRARCYDPLPLLLFQMGCGVLHWNQTIEHEDCFVFKGIWKVHSQSGFVQKSRVRQVFTIVNE